MDSSDLHGKESHLRPPPIWVADSLFGFSDNSSSGLSTPFGSLDSTRTETESEEEEDEEDFLAELTRQIAGYTLQEDEDEHEDPTILLEDPKNISFSPQEHSPKPEEVSTAKEKSSMKKQSSSAPRGGRRAAAKTESTRKRAEQGAEQKKGKRRVSGGRSQVLKNGSGMQAVFLGGGGSSYAAGGSSGGTGVFLPRGINCHGQTEPKKKSACSTVLIPTRVLQVLQLHYSNMDTKLKSNTGAAPPTILPRINNAMQNKREDSLSQSEQLSDVQTEPEMDEREMQLPQEWTY